MTNITISRRIQGDPSLCNPFSIILLGNKIQTIFEGTERKDVCFVQTFQLLQQALYIGHDPERFSFIISGRLSALPFHACSFAGSNFDSLVLQLHPKGPVDCLIYYWPKNIMCTYSLEGRGFQFLWVIPLLLKSCQRHS